MHTVCCVCYPAGPSGTGPSTSSASPNQPITRNMFDEAMASAMNAPQTSSQMQVMQRDFAKSVVVSPFVLNVFLVDGSGLTDGTYIINPMDAKIYKTVHVLVIFKTVVPNEARS